MNLFKKDFNTQVHKKQKEMLVYAQKMADNNGVILDYSDESMIQLDRLIEILHKSLAEEGTETSEQIENEPAALGFCETYGCYIAECIEKNYSKVTWIKDPSHPWPSAGLSNGVLINPLDWVMNKLLDPKGYSITNTYRKWIIETKSS